MLCRGAKLDRVKRWVLNSNRDLRENHVESHEIGGQNSSSERRVFYLCRKFKGKLFSNRDFLFEGFDGSLEKKDGGEYHCVCRSLKDERLHSRKKSNAAGRVRATVQYEGWLLRDLGNAGTQGCFVQNIDPGSALKGAFLK